MTVLAMTGFESSSFLTEQMVLGASMTPDTIQKGAGKPQQQKGQGENGDTKGGYNTFKGKSKSDSKGKGKFQDKG